MDEDLIFAGITLKSREPDSTQTQAIADLGEVVLSHWFSPNERAIIEERLKTYLQSFFSQVVKPSTIANL